MYSEYDLENVRIVGYDVVSNRPKVAAYRAPGVPMAAFGAESVINELALKLGIDTIDIRPKNAAKQGTVNVSGLKYGPTGFTQLPARGKTHTHQPPPPGHTQ